MKPTLWDEEIIRRGEQKDENPLLDFDVLSKADHGWIERPTYLVDYAKSLGNNYEWHLLHEINGLAMLRNCVEVDILRVHGVPVLKGTRFTVAQVLAELSDTSGPDEVADNFDLDVEMIREVLEGLSLMINKPFA